MLAIPSVTRIRRTIGDAARAAQPHTRRAATVLLRAGAFQRVMNRVEERYGNVVLYPRRDFRLSDLAAFTLHASAVQPFVWRSEVAGRSYLVPVDPAFPHPAPHNDPWGPASYWHRPQNRRLRQLYEALLSRRPAGTFLDVGANWGMHSYPFAAHGYRCVAFEPQSACCRFIERVKTLNRFTRVEIVPGVVGGECASEVPFFESEVEAFSSMDQSHVAQFQRPFTPRAVRMVSLDTFCREHELSPSVVKIDAEGFEWEVIRGGQQIIGSCRPAIVVEVSASLEAQRALWTLLAEMDYRCYWCGGPTQAAGHQPFQRIASLDDFVGVGSGWIQQGAERDFVFLQAADAVT